MARLMEPLLLLRTDRYQRRVSDVFYDSLRVLTSIMQPNSTMRMLRTQVGIAGMYYIGQLQYVAVAVMTYNRYTSVVRPLAHKMAKCTL